jgi:hypothetical protein
MNQVKPFVKVMLDKERNLVLDMTAMIAFEEATGKSWLKGEVNLNSMKLKDFCTLLWSMLLTDDPSLTLQQVITLSDLNTVKRLTPPITQAINLALKDEEQKEKSPLTQSP